MVSKYSETPLLQLCDAIHVTKRLESISTAATDRRRRYPGNMQLHPDVEGLTFLLGRWEGRGEGDYPTIDRFEYLETVWFEAGPDKPWISYRQLTKNALTGAPLHTETGYIRVLPGHRLEAIISSPTGITEIDTGTVDGTHIHLRAGTVESTPTALEVADVERHITVDGDTLRYRLSMAAVGHELQQHLAAELTRSGWLRATS